MFLGCVVIGFVWRSGRFLLSFDGVRWPKMRVALVGALGGLRQARKASYSMPSERNDGLGLIHRSPECGGGGCVAKCAVCGSDKFDASALSRVGQSDGAVSVGGPVNRGSSNHGAVGVELQPFFRAESELSRSLLDDPKVIILIKDDHFVVCQHLKNPLLNVDPFRCVTKRLGGDAMDSLSLVVNRNRWLAPALENWIAVDVANGNFNHLVGVIEPRGFGIQK